MKKVIYISVAVILGCIFLSANIFCLITYRAQEHRKVELARHLVKAHAFDTLTIYWIAAFTDNEITENELHNIRHSTWDKKTIASLFQGLFYHHDERTWKGSWLGIAELKDGSRERLAIDQAGYFKIIGDNGYYEITGDSRVVFAEIMETFRLGGNFDNNGKPN